MMKTVLITGVLTLLSGCIPAPLGRYYKPLYPEPAATYSGDLCYGQAGAPAVLTVPLADGVTFTVRATSRQGKSKDGVRELDLRVRVPPGVRFQFTTPHIGVTPVEQGILAAAPLTMAVSATLRLPSRERIEPLRLAPTPLTSPAGVPIYSDYNSYTGWTPSWGDGFIPKAIHLTLPTVQRPGLPDLPIEVQAQARPRPERFPGESKGHTSLIYVSAASDARAADRHRQCLADGPPASACQAILTYDDGGFQIQDGALTLEGRGYVYHVEQGTPLRFDLTLRMQTPAPWQLADHQIRVRSLPDQTERIHTFAHLNLSMRYRVPLDSPVFLPVERASGPQTMVELDTRRPLGTQEAARYEVTLPAVEINGRRYTLPAIQLERHSLDFGLLPFNC